MALTSWICVEYPRHYITKPRTALSVSVVGIFNAQIAVNTIFLISCFFCVPIE